MSVWESLLVGLFGMLVVLVVLFGLSLLLRLQSAILARPTGKRSAIVTEDPTQAVLEISPPLANEPVKLINVDNKTAALIMAIVCDEMQVEPEELYFKSIRAMESNTVESEKLS